MRIAKHYGRVQNRVGARSGVATVEFAIIGTVMAFFTFGMIEAGRGMMVKETHSNAARRGCRQAILPTGSNSVVTAEVDAVLQEHAFKAGDATVQVLINGKVKDASTAVQNDKISVKVTLSVSKVGWIAPVFFSDSSFVTETVVMMRQR